MFLDNQKEYERSTFSAASVSPFFRFFEAFLDCREEAETKEVEFEDPDADDDEREEHEENDDDDEVSVRAATSVSRVRDGSRLRS